MSGFKNVLFILIALLLLSACNTGVQDEADENSNSQNTDEETVTDQDNSEDAEQANDGESNEDLSNFPEITYISDKIEIDQYEMMVETDNEGSRVILYSKDGQKHYKSVYVKDEKRLKLLDIHEGGEPLINEVIQ
ncbi:hypothetical protein [Paraliobacillus salinarum]|uniref:hypothetical protein n=1 Tax=Paraliobacillus salinarum TaxID=1158996 RepID=UPI0015F5904F|nr:hypothetical protein [Paraliobacillus salinarum]